MSIKKSKPRTPNPPVVVTEPQFSFKDKIKAIEVLETSKGPRAKGDNDAREDRLLETLERDVVTELWVTRIPKKSSLAKSIGRQLDSTGRATIELTVELNGKTIRLAHYHWDLDQFRCPRCHGVHGAGNLGKAKEVTDSIANSDLRHYEKRFMGYLVNWVVKGATGPSACMVSRTCFDGSAEGEKHEAKGFRNLILQSPELKAKLVWDLPKEISG